jgi:Rrf2 family protein
MQITRQADYAVRAVLYLAQLENGMRVSTSQIASEQHIPITFLAKIVSQLSAAGVVRTTRGSRGGVTLAKPMSQISLLEVVEAIDGPMTLNDCTHDTSRCVMGDSCTVRVVWCDARNELVQRLADTKFSSLVKIA